MEETHGSAVPTVTHARVARAPSVIGVMGGARAARVDVLRVLVAGQVRLYREGLAQALARIDEYAVVGTASSAAEVLQLAGDLAPDVVLVDLGLPQLGALVRELAERSRKVVVLGVNEADEAILPMIEDGISGYVTRDGSMADMLAAIESAARGESMVSPRVVAGMMRRLATLTREQRSVQGPATLTSREQEIAALIEEGLSNRDIAGRLHIELPTVKNHVHNILEKLKVHRRGEAAARLRGISIRPMNRRTDVLHTGRGPG
jgi:two-component system, NarL family, nitrate/nitrite response regulator NarL